MRMAEVKRCKVGEVPILFQLDYADIVTIGNWIGETLRANGVCIDSMSTGDRAKLVDGCIARVVRGDPVSCAKVIEQFLARKKHA